MTRAPGNLELDGLGGGGISFAGGSRDFNESAPAPMMTRQPMGRMNPINRGGFGSGRIGASFNPRSIGQAPTMPNPRPMLDRIQSMRPSPTMQRGGMMPQRRPFPGMFQRMGRNFMDNIQNPDFLANLSRLMQQRFGGGM